MLGTVNIVSCAIVLAVPDEALKFTVNKYFPIDSLLNVFHAIVVLCT